MTPDLLPCPFCNGKACFDRFGSSRVSTIVVCEDCGVTHESGETFDHGRTWNTRATSAAAQLLLSHIENNNDIRQSIDPSGHCVKLIHGLRAIAKEGK